MAACQYEEGPSGEEAPAGDCFGAALVEDSVRSRGELRGRFKRAMVLAAEGTYGMTDKEAYQVERENLANVDRVVWSLIEQATGAQLAKAFGSKVIRRKT